MKRKQNGKQQESAILHTLSGVIQSRLDLASRIGKSFKNDKRDSWKVFGYKTILTFDDFWQMYKRGGIAKKIVDMPVKESWRLRPEIFESDKVNEDETEFEKQWKDLCKRLKIFHYIARVDRLARIGEYAVLFLGFDDVKNRDEFQNPVINNVDLKYIMPYKQSDIQILTWDENPKSERFNKPETYNIAISERKGMSAMPTSSSSVNKTYIKVHHSRVIHVANDLLDDDVFGTPAMEAVFNRLENLELLCGASIEMFWRGSKTRHIIKPVEGATWDDSEQTKAQLEDELEKFVHDLQDYLKVKNVEFIPIEQQIADPKANFEILMDLISAISEIPKRIFFGSERGELASSQDETNWNTKMDERRTNQNEPFILRPLIDRLITVGVLPQVEEYDVKWPEMFTPSETEKAANANVRTQAIAAYANSMGADMVVPVEIYLRKYFDFTQEEIDKIKSIVDSQQEQEQQKEEQQKEDEESFAFKEEYKVIK